MFLCFAGQISDSQSLFTYPDGQTVANFSFPAHMPVFLDELDNGTLSSAREVCGTDPQCIYDFSQTGNEELAMATMATNRDNEMGQMLSSEFFDECTIIVLLSELSSIAANQPPRLNGSAVFMVTMGQPSTYQFTANDTNEFSLRVLGNLSGTLVMNADGMYTYTVNQHATSNSTVSFAARDALNASTLLNPLVYMCACQNGNCTLEGVLNRNIDPLVMNCACPEGELDQVTRVMIINTSCSFSAYTGRFCEEDVDGCAMQSCFEGVNCTDNQAPQTGATCGPCPTGLEGNGMRCTGKTIMFPLAI